MNATGLSRFLDSNGAAYACELGRLAHELVAASKGALLHRLECIYDEILIDEVQDLSSHDWEIVDVLLGSSLDVRMVGDIRQSVLATNPHSSKNKQYAYAKAINWFLEREVRGVLVIDEITTSWRCRPEIAAFSDSIFDSHWSFPKTESANQRVTGHDGVFLLHRENVDAYLARYRPQCLRDRANSGKTLNLDYMNFGVSKGTSYERVLIVPTGGITEFIRSGKHLKPISAARLYVAVTRAEQSVAIVIDDPGKSTLPYWDP
jgi:superfamily I DNA/RNA helicase